MNMVRGAECGVLEALRDATRVRHAALRSSPAMLRLFDSAFTLADYRLHLGRLLGFFEPLERAVDAAADAAYPVDAFRRSGALRSDLRCLGTVPLEIEAFERIEALPPIASAGLRGYAYVILGATLGGKLIVERLRKVLGPAASFHFYGDGHARSEDAWAAYCNELEGNGEHDRAAICATAAGIFEAYERWLSEPAVPAAGR